MPQNFRLRFNGSAASRQIREGAAAGVYLAAEHVLGLATNVVPLDEGYLQSTGTASVDTPSLTGMVSFDGPYAVRQHEELSWRHAPGRTAKYLENSLNAARPEVAAIIAAQVRRAMR
ncbi:hypothetical protein ACFZBC_09110 [Streptomyces luteogriseus]|uniref:hypothetical protein n=1 Tax=Streptomyces luteogriseus TaxID=68233 RepID=UPI0036F1178B